MTLSLLTTDAAIRSLLTRARTIAVVGISDRRGRDSNTVSQYLLSQGYTIIPINPLLSRWAGLQAYPDLDHAPLPIDVVDIFRRPEAVPPVVEAAIRIGARAVWMQFGVGHDAAARTALDAGLEVVMERCIMVEHRRLLAQGPA